MLHTEELLPVHEPEELVVICIKSEELLVTVVEMEALLLLTLACLGHLASLMRLLATL